MVPIGFTLKYLKCFLVMITMLCCYGQQGAGGGGGGIRYKHITSQVHMARLELNVQKIPIGIFSFTALSLFPQ